MSMYCLLYVNYIVSMFESETNQLEYFFDLKAFLANLKGGRIDWKKLQGLISTNYRLQKISMGQVRYKVPKIYN